MTEPPKSQRWVTELRSLHEENFAFDWDNHVRELNARLGLSGAGEFGLAPGLPPSWLVGDVAALAPRQWVLVVSLNQARREEEEAWHVERRYTSGTYWEHWRWLNRDWSEPRFYRPLVRLAAAALDVDVDSEQESEFATSRMIFIELCPYPSRQFAFSGDELADLAQEDRGFLLASQVRRLLIEQAEPGLVMVNGAAALRSIALFDDGHLDLRRRRYTSASRPQKELWHEEGHYVIEPGSVPVVGFPFLRKPQTHNSYAEIDQLGVMARALVEG